MGNNSVPKFIFRLSRFAVYRESVLGRFYYINHTQTQVSNRSANKIRFRCAWKELQDILQCNTYIHLVKSDAVWRTYTRS